MKNHSKKIKIKLKKLTLANFYKYGKIIEYSGVRNPKKVNLFEIIMREPKSGWRIAYLIVRDKHINKMESHPMSFESFEPCCGRSLLFVSTQDSLKKIDCFLLEKPIILKKGIWHGVISLSKESEIKIVENSRVKCLYKKLHGTLSASIATRK